MLPFYFSLLLLLCFCFSFSVTCENPFSLDEVPYYCCCCCRCRCECCYFILCGTRRAFCPSDDVFVEISFHFLDVVLYTRLCASSKESPPSISPSTSSFFGIEPKRFSCQICQTNCSFTVELKSQSRTNRWTNERNKFHVVYRPRETSRLTGLYTLRTWRIWSKRCRLGGALTQNEVALTNRPVNDRYQ